MASRLKYTQNSDIYYLVYALLTVYLRLIIIWIHVLVYVINQLWVFESNS